MTELDDLHTAYECCRALLSKKGQSISILHIEKVSTFTDYFVICTGTSDRHVKALYQAVNTHMKKTYEKLPHHVEGEKSGQWILIDYGGVVIHIFFDYLREYYALENLWQEGIIVPVPKELHEQESNRPIES